MPIGEHIRVHDFRRTFATRAAEAGMPIKRLSKILGHSSVAVTERYYAHIDEQDDTQAMAKIAAGLGLDTSFTAKAQQAAGSAF